MIMVLCHQNYSNLFWEKNVLVIKKTFEIRGWSPRICKKFEITRTICTDSEKSEQFMATECLVLLSLGFRNMQEKLDSLILMYEKEK